MNDSKTGIETLLDDVDIRVFIEKETARREAVGKAASKAGKANSARYKRLRDLALKTYLDQFDMLLNANISAQQLIRSGASRKGLLKDLRPPYKNFYRRFLNLSQGRTWNTMEKNWLKRLQPSKPSAPSELTESTLYNWWKGFNKDLKQIL